SPSKDSISASCSSTSSSPACSRRIRRAASSGCSGRTRKSSGRNHPASPSYFPVSRYRTNSTWSPATSATSATSFATAVSWPCYPKPTSENEFGLRASAFLPVREVAKEVFFYGKRNRQVVQRLQGLRLHRARGRHEGRFRPSLEHCRQRLQEPRRRCEGRVRAARRREGTGSDQRRPGRRLVAGKEEKVEFEGEVTEALSNGKYRVRLDNGHHALGYPAGKQRRYRIRTLPGDRVQIELSSYDLNRGRIVYRHR